MSTTLTPQPTTTPPASPRDRAVARPWLTVTVREVMVKLTDKSFIISTIVTLVIIVASLGVSAYFGGRATDHTVAVTSADAAAVVTAAEPTITAGDSGDTLTAVELADAEAARAAVADGEVDAALLPAGDGWTLLGNEEVAGGLETALTTAAGDLALERNAAAAGTTPEALRAGSTLTTELLEDAGQSEIASIVGFVFAFLFYMAAIVFGMTIASSVLEEKQNRVVEILATAIAVRHILYGKVLGNSLLALGQIALYVLVGLVGANLAGLTSDFGWILGASGWFIAFFVVGFVTLASVWAVLGSLASRPEDLQNNTTPIMVVIMVALFTGLFAEGTVLTVASFVPVVSSVAMPIRLLSDDVALWQPIASLVITAAAAYLLLRLGEKIYQRAVMQGGTALSWRQALKLED